MTLSHFDEVVFVCKKQKENNEHVYGIVKTCKNDRIIIKQISKTNYLKSRKDNVCYGLKTTKTYSINIEEFFDYFLLVDDNFKEFGYSELLNLILSSKSLIADKNYQ